MYCKYRRECKQMAKNEGSEANFRMVKRLMEQYDQKETKYGPNVTPKHTPENHNSRHIETNKGNQTQSGSLEASLPRKRSSVYNRYSTLVVKTQQTRGSDFLKERPNAN